MNDRPETSTHAVDFDELYRRLTASDGTLDRQTVEYDFEVRFTVQSGGRYRFRFEPRRDGTGWWRFEDEWTGCRWRPVGREAVSDVELLLSIEDRSDE